MTKKTQSKAPVKRTTSKLSTSNQIDPRAALLARVAGNIASTLVGSPSESIATPEAIATVAVDIAEQILLKAGVTTPIASETAHKAAS